MTPTTISPEFTMPGMDVINIIQCANLGGMEQASLRLMMAMRKLGTCSRLVSLHPVGSLGPLLDEAQIPHQGLDYKGPAGVGIIPSLAALLRAYKAGRVVMTGPHVAAMIAMKIAGRRGSYLAVHFHHTGVKPLHVWRWIYRLALDRFDWVTFPSDFVRNEACQILPAIAERSFTLRCPLSPPAVIHAEQRINARYKFGLGESDLVIGNAGWFIQRKRFDVFLKVAAEVLKRAPHARFLVAGGGEQEAELKQLADTLGISGKVTWLGWLGNLDEFYSALDVLHFNADWDTLPVTPQEAVARGIPVVASLLHGGLREIFDPPLSTRIIDTHDIPSLTAQILDIAADRPTALARAAVSREHFLLVSDPETIALQHLELLRRRP